MCSTGLSKAGLISRHLLTRGPYFSDDSSFSELTKTDQVLLFFKHFCVPFRALSPHTVVLPSCLLYRCGIQSNKVAATESWVPAQLVLHRGHSLRGLSVQHTYGPTECPSLLTSRGASEVTPVAGKRWYLSLDQGVILKITFGSARL